MNSLIENIINEKFVSKAQQKYFYSKINDKSLSPKERRKWEKMAKEHSEKTNFKKLPNKKEEEIDEIVDENGNIPRSKKPTDLNTKGVTSNSTSDEVAKTAHGTMGSYFTNAGINTQGYYNESNLTKTLGFKDTMAKDIDYDDAKKHFEDNLELDPQDSEERMGQLGYDKELGNDKINLIEKPNIFNKIINEILEEEKMNPIVKKQIESLKESIKNNKIPLKDVVNILKK